MACFETGVVSHSSLGLEKLIWPTQGGARWGDGWPAALMNTGGGRSWAPISKDPHILTAAHHVPIVTHADQREKSRKLK